jgi:alkyl sulfatase BDS1-like metallo-beta-lactamase superfamily hydrolase
MNDDRHDTARASAALIRKGDEFEEQLYQVGDNVYVLVGAGIANATMILGERGMIVVDTGESVEQAAEHLRHFRRVTSRPVSAIFYTHSHYVQGTRAYVPEHAVPAVEIWGSERLDGNYRRAAFSPLSPIENTQAAIQVGLLLPPDGPDAVPNLGVGPHFGARDRNASNTRGYLAPNRTVPEAEPLDAVVDGLRIRFIPGYSDEDDSVSMWLPDSGVLITNVVWTVYPNVSPLRGGRYRDPLRWLDAIDQIRALEIEHLVMTHGRPVSGRAEIAAAVRDYRDALQYAYDQTIRGINLGLGPVELACRIKLPEALAQSRLTGQFYGEVAHHVRGIYAGLRGWWGLDAADLEAVDKAFEGERIVAGFGGAAALLSEVRAALEREEFAWAARLASFQLSAQPDDGQAAELKAAALRALALATTNSIARNFYLTEARRLEGRTTVRRSLRAPNLADETIRSLATVRITDYLRYRIDPERAAGRDVVMHLKLSDTGEQIGLHLRHGLLEIAERSFDHPAIVAVSGKLPWSRFCLGRSSSAELMDHIVPVNDSDPGALEDWLSLFES